MKKTKPLGLGIDPKTIASADWSDDEEPTGSGPVDDLKPIGRVTPVPGDRVVQFGVFDPRQLDSAESFISAQQRGYEPDEEPTLLGPNPAITEEAMRASGNTFSSVGASAPGLAALRKAYPMRELNEPDEKQAFLDRVAVQLFVRGWSHDNIYQHAERLWAIRERYLQRKR